MTNKDIQLIIPRNGLIGEWMFDGYARDTNGGTKNDLTLFNNTRGSSDIGYQKQIGVFNGTNTYGDTALRPSGNSTFSFWFRPTSVAGTSIVTKVFKLTGTGGTAFDFTYDHSSTSLVQSFWIQNTGGTSFISKINTPMQANTWYHIVGTFDGQYVRVYLNGQLEGTSTLFSGTPITSSGFNIGRNTDGSSYISGGIGLFRVYNRAINESKIKQLYLEGLRAGGSKGSNLLRGIIGQYSFLRFKEPYGTNVLFMGNSASDLQPTAVGSSGQWGSDKNGIQGGIFSASTSSSVSLGTGYNNMASFTITMDLITNQTTTCVPLYMAGANLGGRASIGIYLNDVSSGSIRFRTWDVQDLLITGTNINNSQWHTLTVSFNGTTFQKSIYLDGVLIGTNTAANANVYAGYLMGLFNSYTGNTLETSTAFTGAIGSLYIQDRVLSSGEVLGLHNLIKYWYPNLFEKSLKRAKSYGLAQWLTFLRSNTTTLIDSSGNGLSATCAVAIGTNTRSNMLVYNRLNNHCIRFNNSLSTYLYGNRSSMLENQNFSIGFWMSSSTRIGYLYQYIRNNTSLNTSIGIAIYNNGSTGSIQYTQEDGSTVNTDIRTTSSYDICDGKYHHVMITKSSGGSLKIYIDGKLFSSATGVPNVSYDGTNSPGYNIGAVGSFTRSNYYNGDMSNFMIFQKELSYEEVQSIYFDTFIM